TPARIAGLLRDRGYGDSRMTVFGAMGGPAETRQDGRAADWSDEAPAFNTLAVDCIAGPGARILARTPGLPDAAFDHDGAIAPRDLRAIALSRLMPMRGATLWDIGAGCGAVGIEWLRAARDGRAIGLEPDPARRALAAANAVRLGAPRLDLRSARAPEGLADLPAPDAVFIGGGLSAAVAEAALAALK